MAKNWYKEFFDFAKKHGVWVSVFADGQIDEITPTQIAEDEQAPSGLYIGTKAACDWLIKTVKEMEAENGRN